MIDSAKNLLTSEGLKILITAKWSNLKELFLGTIHLMQLTTYSAREV